MNQRINRFVHAVCRKGCDRIPKNYYATPEFSAELSEHFGTDIDDVVYGIFDVDRKRFGEHNEVRYIGPEPIVNEDGSFHSIFGTHQKNVNYGKGDYVETVYHPLKEITDTAAIDSFPWPSADWWEYADVARLCEQNQEYPLTIGYAAVGWFTWEMFGVERFLENCLLEPQAIEAVIENVSNYCFEYYRRLIEAGKNAIGKNFNAIHLADDLAIQNTTIMSESLIRKYFTKSYRKLIDLAHSNGLLVEFHCCGSARPLIPFFIQMGVDLLNPMQTSAKGMIPHELQKEFGNYIAFSGGLDVQQLLPFASVTKVKDYVKYMLDTFKTGYVFEPAHNIQIGTPIENVIAMYQAYNEYYGLHNDRLEC